MTTNPPRDVSRRRRWLLALVVLTLAGVSGGVCGFQWWTRRQLRTAESLAADLRFEEAGKLLDEYLRVRPSDADARLAAVRAKRQAGDPDAAEHHLDEFDRRHGASRVSSQERVLLQAERGALGNKEAEYLARLERGDPDAAFLLEVLARNDMSCGRPLDALPFLNGLVAKSPRHPRALAWRARTWGQLRKWDNAFEDARRAVELRPGSPEARSIWAEANEHVGHTELAAREYGWLYDRGHKSPDVALGLGRCRQDLGRFAEARQVLDAFLAEHPTSADVLVERGRLEVREGATAAAEPYFRRAALADPDHIEAHRFLLRCLETGGNPEEAARVGGRLRQLEVRAGRIEQLRTAVDAAPDDAEPRYRLGAFLLVNGREEEGRNLLNSVLLLDPSHRPARAALAAHSKRAGRQHGEGGDK